MMLPTGRREEGERPRFGLGRERPDRLEISFALKSGGVVTVYHNVGEEVDAEQISRFVDELSAAIAQDPKPRSFADDWNHTGQRAWVNLAEVVAFAVRPAR